jgi:hypothetical protein
MRRLTERWIVSLSACQKSDSAMLLPPRFPAAEQPASFATILPDAVSQDNAEMVAARRRCRTTAECLIAMPAPADARLRT